MEKKESTKNSNYYSKSNKKLLSFIHEVDSHFEEDEHLSRRGTSYGVDLTTQDILTNSNNTFDSGRNSSKRTNRRNLHSEIERKDIQEATEAYEYLMKRGVLSNLGQNQQGIYYFVVYGYAYVRSQDANERQRLSQAFGALAKHLAFIYKWAMIYVHSTVGATRKGALIRFKEIYSEFNQQQKKNFQQLYVIQPSFFVRTRIIFQSCNSGIVREALQKIQTFNKIKKFVAQLKIEEQDTTVLARFIRSLPTPILEVYKREIKALKPKDIEQLNFKESILQPNNSITDDLMQEPEFLKKFLSFSINQSIRNSTVMQSTNNSQNDLSSSKNEKSQNIFQEQEEQAQLTHDIIGKNLSVYFRQDEDEPPEIFQQIYDYFIDDEKRMHRKDLFQRLKPEDLIKVDRIDCHISLGDYNHIHEIKDSTIVAFYLKSVIKYMEQPLCTFALFDKFKQISKLVANIQKNGEKEDLNDLVQSIKEIFEYIPPIYFQVWELMINLFKQLVINSNKNNWRNFSELLILIIQNKDKIFWNSKQRISSQTIEIEVNNGFSEETKSQQTE
eukprot:403346801